MSEEVKIIKAVVVYLIRDEQMLTILGKKSYAPHFELLNGLGGKFEPQDNDDPIACACREVKEEGNVDVKNLELLGEIDFIGMFPDKEFYVYFFLTNDFTGTPRCNPEEGELVWVPIHNLPLDRFLPNDQVFLPWILAKKKFKAVFHLDGRKYIDHTVTFLV